MSSSAPGSENVDPTAAEQNRGLKTPLVEEIFRLVRALETHQGALEQQIDDLRTTQQHLEAYRDRYVDLYDSAPLGYVTLDQDGFVQEINLMGARMVGAEREALIGYPFADYVLKEDRAAFLDHVHACAGQRREVTGEFRLVARDGKSLAVQVHSMPIGGHHDDTLCKSAITDITRRRCGEEALRQSQAFLQTVIDAIPDTLLVVGRDYRVLLANRAAREMTGGEDPAVACLSCHRLSHRRELPCAGTAEPCPLREVLATKRGASVTHTHVNDDGREHFVEITAAPVFDEAGEVTSIIETCRDVTDRKRAQDALEAERSLLRTLIDNLPDLVYVKDAEGRFLTANLATARIMGAAAPAELLGKTDGDFYDPALAAEYRADEQRVLRSGEPLVDKLEPHVDPAGRRRTLLTTKVPFRDSRGRVGGLVGISRDVTDRHPPAENDPR